MVRTIKANAFMDLLNACRKLQPDYLTLAPTYDDGPRNFLPIEQMGEAQLQVVEAIAFENRAPVGSIKSFFFPDTEVYLEFSRRGNQIDIQEPAAMKPQIILGAKACDVRSVELIDKVFLADPVDTLYEEKREKTTIVVTVCAEEGSGCNCREFDVPFIPQSADVVMQKGELGEVHLTAIGAKGEQLLEQLLAVGGFEVVADFQLKEMPNSSKRLSPKQLEERMDELFESPVWDQLAMLCIGCGTCTYYCPTCHCYDIRDFNRRDQGARYRTWDSCMFANFTNMAGNHNPRPTKKDRIRNRFFHKLNYFIKKQGDIACVGCGRCAELCPVGISINRVINMIGGELHGS